MSNSGLDGLKAFWDSMTAQQRKDLASNLNKFNGLIGSMKNRGIIEADKLLTTITILKRDPDVKKLKELLKLINAGGIKIVDKRS